ncbi:MAG: zinc ribbon domain-containing protein [Deltaproteobacteria bacterium]|nr:zinc ribbon domain-containing protein [Deltaproteobacteria bacterium]
MPLYEFRCQQCNKSFEALLTSSSLEALAEVKCPACGSKNVVKTISASSYRVSGGSSAPTLGKPLGGCASRGGFS